MKERMKQKTGAKRSAKTITIAARILFCSIKEIKNSEIFKLNRISVKMKTPDSWILHILLHAMKENMTHTLGNYNWFELIGHLDSNGNVIE